MTDDGRSLTKKFSYKSFFVFEIQMIENLVKIASVLLSYLDYLGSLATIIIKGARQSQTQPDSSLSFP
jgi:hypothetical protein